MIRCRDVADLRLDIMSMHLCSCYYYFCVVIVIIVVEAMHTNNFTRR